jgi:hypothetical protein
MAVKFTHMRITNHSYNKLESLFPEIFHVIPGVRNPVAYLEGIYHPTFLHKQRMN